MSKPPQEVVFTIGFKFARGGKGPDSSSDYYTRVEQFEKILKIAMKQFFNIDVLTIETQRTRGGRAVPSTGPSAIADR